MLFSNSMVAIWLTSQFSFARPTLPLVDTFTSIGNSRKSIFFPLLSKPKSRPLSFSNWQNWQKDLGWRRFAYKECLPYQLIKSSFISFVQSQSNHQSDHPLSKMQVCSTSFICWLLQPPCKSIQIQEVQSIHAWERNTIRQ